MIDKLAIVFMLILYILFGFIVLCTYLLVRGANENKTEWEQKNDDDEQMEIVSRKEK